MRAKRIHVALSAVAIAVLACTIGQSPPGSADLPATITAQVTTLQAPSATLGSLTQTPAPLLTNTPSVPEARVSSTTNCRTGPGIVYDLLWTMYPADVAVVVGKHTPTGYWIVNKPNGGTCWLWGQYATVSGNIAALPEHPQPPTPTPSEPAAPTNFKVTASCTVIPATLTYSVHITMTWVDVATNEQGYRIFRNGSLLATLAANSTSYEHDTTLPVAPAVFPPVPGPSINYAIEAFNGSGESQRKDRDVGCD
jgi:hypothetical protein